MKSAFYFGTVAHRRLRPRRHHLHYRLFWLLVDLDELAALDAQVMGFSHNRFNLLSLHDRDHGDGSTAPLRDQIARRLAAAGIDLGGGAVRLLAMPRVLGYGFNPLSIYFCHFRDGAPAAILYEVHNTFGERHTYLVRQGPAQAGAHSATKCFHVSPFLAMGLRYDFRTSLPGERLSVAIVGSDSEGRIIVAAMQGRRRPFDSRQVAGALIQFPFMTLKVIWAIHWNALLLWLKRVPFRRKPPPPSRAVTVIGSETQP